MIVGESKLHKKKAFAIIFTFSNHQYQFMNHFYFHVHRESADSYQNLSHNRFQVLQ